jgi:hypothetical protein
MCIPLERIFDITNHLSNNIHKTAANVNEPIITAFFMRIMFLLDNHNEKQESAKKSNIGIFIKQTIS